MSSLTAENKIKDILKRADIKVGGGRAWDIDIHNANFYNCVLTGGSLGLGESYMDGWWDSPNLDQFFDLLLKAGIDQHYKYSPGNIFLFLKSSILNQQTKKGSTKVAKQHYDLSLELYKTFLDPYLQYTCGYFKDTNDLNTAQEQKMDLICKKLRLSANDRVLDIGCGWGGFAKFASERYGCHVTAVTISQEQYKYGKEFCKGLPVTMLNQDYRDIQGKFSKVACVGIVEHVGYKNYRRLMEKVSEVLEDDGLFLLHTIGRNDSIVATDPWFEKYIFPNSMLPSIKQLSSAFEGLLVMEDWHNFGAYYEKTCLAWFKNFDDNWEKLKNKYDRRFYRMWKYYLLASAGGFKSRTIQLWQIVLSKKGVPGGYITER